MRTPYAECYAIILLWHDTHLNKHQDSLLVQYCQLCLYARTQTNTTEHGLILWLCRSADNEGPLWGRVWHDMGIGVRIML